MGYPETTLHRWDGLGVFFQTGDVRDVIDDGAVRCVGCGSMAFGLRHRPDVNPVIHGLAGPALFVEPGGALFRQCRELGVLRLFLLLVVYLRVDPVVCDHNLAGACLVVRKVGALDLLLKCFPVLGYHRVDGSPGIPPSIVGQASRHAIETSLILGRLGLALRFQHELLQRLVEVLLEALSGTVGVPGSGEQPCNRERRPYREPGGRSQPRMASVLRCIRPEPVEDGAEQPRRPVADKLLPNRGRFLGKGGELVGVHQLHQRGVERVGFLSVALQL